MKKVGVPFTPLRTPLRKSSRTRARMRLRRQLAAEPLVVEAELDRIVDQVAIVERVLMLEQRVVHLPERPLRAGRLCGFRRMLRVRMDLA